MEQYIQTGALRRRYGDHRNISQHLRQTVHIDLHPPFLHDIHHIQRHNHRLSQLQQLKGQIQIPFQGRRIHHIYNYINIIAHGTLPGYLLLNGIAGQRIYTGSIDQRNFRILVFCGSLKSLHCHSGPVGHLQPGTCQCVKQCGLAAVRIPYTDSIDMLFLLFLAHAYSSAPVS